MSSTNKTTNYELSQFVGSDKPAWLQDYNADMSKIDAGIHTAATTATGADGKADANTTSIGTLTNLTTDAKTSLVAAVNEVDSNADTAQNTANTAITKSTANEQSIATIANILNLNTTLTYTSSNATTNNGTLGAGELYVSRNSDGSLFKVYGNILLTSATGGNVEITLPNTGVSSTSSYTIVGCGYTTSTENSQSTVRPISIDVGTNGNLKVKFIIGGGGVVAGVRPVACLYFNSDFGNIQPSA